MPTQTFTFGLIILLILVFYLRSRKKKESDYVENTKPDYASELTSVIEENYKQATVKEYKKPPPKPFMRGSFELMGDWSMNLDKFQDVVGRIKQGEELELRPDPNNQYDNKAINVYYKEDLIGYVPKACTKKGELFKRMMTGEEVTAKCGLNRAWVGKKDNKMLFDSGIEYEFIN